MVKKFFSTCMSGLLLTCSFGYSQSTTLSGNDNSWRIAINPNGTIRSYETYRNGVWNSIPFRNDSKSGPCWDGINLSLTDENNLVFEGTQNQITYRLQYTSAGDHLALKAEIINQSQVEFSPLAARLIVGVNSEMRTFPDWNDKFFPTLLRCEKTHLWGYFMSPLQRILGICTSEPVASYNLNYIQEGNMNWNFGHQIKTASLDLLHRLPLPARHPQDLASLRPGEKKQWTIHLGEIDKLENVKPTLALWGNNPLIECSQYTVAEGETITYELFGCNTKNSKIELLTPSGKMMPVSGKSISFKEGKGVYTIRLTVGAKTSEAMVNVRENWSWYLKNARDQVFKYPPIIGSSCEQYYGYYTAFIGTKYFPDKAKDKMLIKRFENDLARLWDPVSWTPNPDPRTYPNRVQNHSTTIGILVKLWEATNELKYLEQAAHIADYLASDKVQTPDGVYRSNGVYYTAVAYMAKSMLELAVFEKKLISEPVWKERYERHFNSAARAINDLLIRRDDIDTEGDLTFEDGMIACCALQLGLFGLWQENEELKNVYANAAKYVLDKHQCLEQLQIPDTRMRGATLRYWEAMDIFFLPNQVMNSPHGWTGWKIYASYYLYLLTGNEFYLRDFMDTLGAAAQIMDNTGKLRWAFLPDPFVQAKILVENPQQPRAALQIDSVIGEQYVDKISPWYRPDDDDNEFHPFSPGKDGLGEKGAAGDNTGHEIYKVMEECALTQAYIIVREDGSVQAWNCKASKKGATIDVVPNEHYIDKLHVNSKIPVTVTVSLDGKKHKTKVTGMQWVGEQPQFLPTQPASAQRIDLTTRQDTSRILLNPDKGWYHHYMDNSITDYGLTSEAELDTFPGMHHLFIRIPWVYLEPEEGQFRWETIDTVVTRYADKGYKLSLDITCKETWGELLPYATPQWVEKAGAKGQLIDSHGSSNNWEPDYNDPVFLEKLNNFHKAMAARYDGAEWLQDVTTGSIGEWGEGHSRQKVSADVVIKHLDILLNNYKNTQIVIGDDYLRNQKTAEETKILREYVKKKRVSYRDDSILFEGVLNYPGSVQNADFFEDVWKDSPTTLEMCHYYYCKDKKHWSIPNGYEKGLDIIKDAIRVAHATFISPHGHIGEWQKDNPQAAWDIINRIGYWIVPEWAELKLHEKQLNLSVAWNNKGVAPAYKPYLLKIFLIDKKGKKKELPSTDAGNREWLPGITTAHYTLDASGISKGVYEVEILLYKQFRNGTTRPVQLGLKQKYESLSGAYNIGKIKL